jgi:predicted CopG family antitoxin
MTKTIQVDEDVYQFLLSKKRKGESFSETVRRLAAKRRETQSGLFGVLADLPEKDFQRFREAALDVDKPLPEEFGWKKRARK